MGSLIAGLGFTSESIEAGLSASPHRGSFSSVAGMGRGWLGIAAWPDSNDAWLAKQGELLGAFTGHLGNRPELIKELGISDESDPAEILLEAWEAWGEKTPNRLRGEYAAAVTDGQNLLCFRDHFGFGTLFYHEQGSRIIVASEAKQVAAAADIPRQPDLEKLERLFWGESEDGEPPCVVVGVERVPRSSLVRWIDGGRLASRYWNPSELVDTASMTFEEAKERTYRLLDQAVRRTLTGSDAVSLSGGIDSPTIAAVAAPRHLEMTGRPLKSISTVYPHAPSVDESYYIEQVVSHLGLESHTFIPQYTRLQRIQDWVDLLDGPGSPAAYEALAEFLGVARDLGLESVLLGDLAEFVYDIRDHVMGHLISTGRWGTARRHWRGHRKSGRSFASLLRQTSVSLLPSYLSGFYRIVRSQPIEPLVSWAADPTRLSELGHRVDLKRPIRQRWRAMQTWYADAGSSNSIEAFSICAEFCRVKVHRPLNDVDLTEFFISLPAHLKFPDSRSKSLIRETMRPYLPAEIIDRPEKTSFNEDTLSRVDYSELRRWLLDTEYRMPRINYALLESRLDEQDMDFWELRTAHNLADYHAFVSLWE